MKRQRVVNEIGEEYSAKSILDKRLMAQVFLGAPAVSIGTQIMKRLGWRSGQGVGPRKKRKPENGNDDIHSQNHLFAPKESIMGDSISVKRNLFGVGYDPVKNAPEFAAHAAAASNSTALQKREGTSFLGIKGGGFGEGVMNDDDGYEEDYEVYGISIFQ
jgi:G patch domain-containing protein 1